VAYNEASARLGLSVASAIHRLRARFRALLYAEVAKTVAEPENVERELRHLLTALGD